MTLTRLGISSSPEETPVTAEGWRVRWGVVVQVVSWAVALTVAYNALTGRITKLETYREGDSQRMERIEAKLDRLLERTRP